MEMDPHIRETEKDKKVPWIHSSCKTVLIAVRWHEEKRIDLEYYRVPRSHHLTHAYPYYLVPINERKKRTECVQDEDWICFMKLLGHCPDTCSQYNSCQGIRVPTPSTFDPNEYVIYVDYTDVRLRIAPYKQCSRCQKWWVAPCKTCKVLNKNSSR